MISNPRHDALEKADEEPEVLDAEPIDGMMVQASPPGRPAPRGVTAYTMGRMVGALGSFILGLIRYRTQDSTRWKSDERLEMNPGRRSVPGDRAGSGRRRGWHKNRYRRNWKGS